VIVNNSTNINKTNYHFSRQLIEHKNKLQQLITLKVQSMVLLYSMA